MKQTDVVDHKIQKLKEELEKPVEGQNKFKIARLKKSIERNKNIAYCMCRRRRRFKEKNTKQGRIKRK